MTTMAVPPAPSVEPSPSPSTKDNHDHRVGSVVHHLISLPAAVGRACTRHFVELSPANSLSFLFDVQSPEPSSSTDMINWRRAASKSPCMTDIPKGPLENRPKQQQQQQQQQLGLMALPDDVLRCVLQKLLQPVVVVGGRARVTGASLRGVLPAAAACTRLRALVATLLEDIDLSAGVGDAEDGGVGERDAELLRAAVRVGGCRLRRLYLRGRTDTPGDLLLAARALPSGCALRTLDLSFHVGASDAVLTALTCSAAASLRALLLRGCARLTGGAVVAAAARCNELEAFDVSAVPGLDDGAVARVVRARAGTLRVFAASHCPRVGDAALRAIARASEPPPPLGDGTGLEGHTQGQGRGVLRLHALFVRGCPRVSDAGVRSLAAAPVTSELRTLDVVDCPRVTPAAFAALRAACPAVSERLDAAGVFPRLLPPAGRECPRRRRRFRPASAGAPPDAALGGGEEEEDEGVGSADDAGRREALRCAVAALDDYAVVVRGRDAAGRPSVLVGLADAASAPAVEALLAARATLHVHPHVVRVLARAPGPDLSARRKRALHRDFGLSL